MKPTRPCLAPEEMDTLDASALGHIEECSRCRALYAAYRSYLETADAPAGARLDEARSTLDSLIEARYGPPTPLASERGGGNAMRRRASGRRWLLWGFAPVACCAALVLFALHGRFAPDRDRPMTLRGAHEALFGIEPVLARPDGAVVLRWRAVARATRYRVRLYDAELRLLEETPDQADTMLVLPPGGTSRLWRVTAYQGTMKLSESEVGTIDPR